MKKLLLVGVVMAFIGIGAVAVKAITVNPAASVTGDSASTADTVVYRDDNADFAAHNITANAFIGPVEAVGVGVNNLATGSSTGSLVGYSTFTITSAGLFGVGTGLPSANLHINPALAQQNANAFLVGSSTFAVLRSGLVGIGTTSPVSTLDLNGSASFGAATTQSTFTTTGALNIAPSAAVTLSGANGNMISASSITTTGTLFGGAAIITGGKVGINTSTPSLNLEIGSGIAAAQQSINGSSSGGSALFLRTISANSAAFQYAAPDTYLDYSGTLHERSGVGGNDFTGISNSGVIYQSVKSCSTGLQSSSTGSINACVASDMALKENIRPLVVNLDIIDKLKPSTWNWKPSERAARGHGTYAGQVAQDVEKVFPIAIVPAGKGIKGIDANALLALYALEIQDLRKRIAILEKK